MVPSNRRVGACLYRGVVLYDSRVVACLYRGVVLYNSRIGGICTEESFYITVG